MVCWSDLQADLVWKIVHDHGLDNAVDAIRVRSVCRSWRNSIPAALVPYDHLRLPTETEGTNAKTPPPPTLVENTVWFLQSSPPSPGCLILFSKAGNGRRRSISNPILQDTQQLQATTHPWVLNSLQVRVYEIARFHLLRETKPVDGRRQPCVSKAIVLPSSIWSKPNHLAVLALPESKHVKLWRYGDKKWTVMQGSGTGSFRFEDIAIFQDQFVAVDARGAVFSINLATKQAEELGPPQTETILPKSVWRLVVSGGDLYVVKIQEKWDFEIHMLRCKGGTKCWVEVNDLGSRALFCGQTSFFLIEADECRDCRSNCIYYHDRNRVTIRELHLQQRDAPRDLVFSNPGGGWEVQSSCSGVMKFSIATYSIGDYMTGFGGLLRDSDGRIRAMFSGKMEEEWRVKTEVGKLLVMIRFAMGVFYKGGWSGKKKLVVEFSCSRTLGFMFPLLSLIRPTDDYLWLVGEVGYSCVGLQVNADAVEIAKKGLDRPSIFQAWD